MEADFAIHWLSWRFFSRATFVISGGMDEFQRIETFFGPLVKTSRALNLRDDVAVLSSGESRRSLVVTTDALVEGVHFLPTDPIETVARKLVRVNVSDILSKGARPLDALLTLGWPSNRGDDELECFAKALGEELASWGINLIGGDTVRAPSQLFFSLTLTGDCHGEGPIQRSGAIAGDDIWVTGDIGWGYLGLQAAMSDHVGSIDAIQRYREPALPFNGISDLIADFATSSMDVSDGLLGDLQKICLASGVGATLHAEQVPLAIPVESWDQAVPQLTGGDDYQILFTATPDLASTIRQRSEQLRVQITKIGTINLNGGITAFWLGNPVELPKRLGFAHE
ncbi:MAG: thiamine-phosphate kinase [Planctomycetota bacterium]